MWWEVDMEKQHFSGVHSELQSVSLNWDSRAFVIPRLDKDHGGRESFSVI